jgi:AcrR family transcriptional regulator
MPGSPAMSPRKLPKQERARATVEAILTATAHILVRDGFDAACTNRIAAKAGVSIGSLYQYFPTKEALVAALLERHVNDMLAVATTGLAGLDSKSSLRRQTRTMVRTMFAAHAVDPALHRVFMEEMPRGRHLPRIVEMGRAFEALARDSLDRNRARIRPRDLGVATFILVQAIEALTHAAVLHRPEMLERGEFVDEITELIVRYLTPERRSSRRSTRERAPSRPCPRKRRARPALSTEDPSGRAGAGHRSGREVERS